MELLKELTEACGAPGFEDEVRSIVLREIDGLVDEVEYDKLGSVIAIKRGNGKEGEKVKVMLAGHMDEIGFVVNYIDDEGFLRITPLGGFDPKTLIAKRVYVHTKKERLLGVIGTKPIHIMTPEDRKKMPTLEDLFIDLGLPGDEVKKQVDIGDSVTLKQDFAKIGNLVTAKSLDNRIAVWTLIRTLQKLQNVEHNADVYAVFTTQEEVGLRGAFTSAYHVNPDVGIAIDVTLACDVPGVQKKDYVTEVGKGVALQICDGTAISNPKLVRFVRELAEKRNIPHQLDLMVKGGTDAGGMQKSRAGVPVMATSIPTRYIHSVVETAHENDMNATVDIVTAFLEEVHKADFRYV